MYENSLVALHKILEIPQVTEAESIHSPDVTCKITTIPTQITYLENGIKYYCIEVTCEDGRQYAIQAYGDEAETLFSEAHKCVLCGNSVKEEEKRSLIEKRLRMVTWYSSKTTVKNHSKDLKVYMEKSSSNISDRQLMFPDTI